MWILEFATCGELSKTSLGMVHAQRGVNSPNQGKQTLPGIWANSHKNCSLELCRVSDQTPEIRLQIPCCSSQRLRQTPSTSCAQSGKVCPLPSVQRSSPVSQGQHPLPSPTLYSSELGWERCIGKSHHQYDDGCHFGTLSLIKALPGAFYKHLWGRLVIILRVQRAAHAQTGCSTLPSSHGKEVAEVEIEPHSKSLCPVFFLLCFHYGERGWGVGDSRQPETWKNRCLQSKKECLSQMLTWSYWVPSCITLQGSQLMRIHLKAKGSECQGLWVNNVKVEGTPLLSQSLRAPCPLRYLSLKEQSWGSWSKWHLLSWPSVYSWFSKRKRKDSTKPNQTNKQQNIATETAAPGLSLVPRTFTTIYFRKRATTETQLYLVLQAGVFKHQWEWLDMLSSQFIATPQVDGMFYSLVNFLRPRLDMQSLCKMVWK